MKKYLSILLALILMLSFVACNNSQGEGETPTPDTAGFQKPQNYVTVIKVTINPEFNLYLDASGNVLAVEPCNDDAKKVVEKIETQTGSIETVMENIVTATNEDGYIKENATIDIKVTEIKDTTVDAQVILDKAKTSTDNGIKKFENAVVVNINVSVDENAHNNGGMETNKLVASTSIPDDERPVTPEPQSTPDNNNNNDHHADEDAKKTPAPTKKPTNTPTATPEPEYTKISKKDGKWKTMYVSGETLYKLTMTLVGEPQFGVSLGDLVNIDEILPQEKELCTEFNGKNYYVARGTGDGIEAVSEARNRIIIVDLEGNKMVLNRTGENTMTVVSVDANFSEISNIPVGTVLTYSA